MFRFAHHSFCAWICLPQDWCAPKRICLVFSRNSQGLQSLLITSSQQVLESWEFSSEPTTWLCNAVLPLPLHRRGRDLVERSPMAILLLSPHVYGTNDAKEPNYEAVLVLKVYLDLLLGDELDLQARQVLVFRWESYCPALFQFVRVRKALFEDPFSIDPGSDCSTSVFATSSYLLDSSIIRWQCTSITHLVYSSLSTLTIWFLPNIPYIRIVSVSVQRPSSKRGRAASSPRQYRVNFEGFQRVHVALSKPWTRHEVENAVSGSLKLIPRRMCPSCFYLSHSSFNSGNASRDRNIAYPWQVTDTGYITQMGLSRGYITRYSCSSLISTY